MVGEHSELDNFVFTYFIIAGIISIFAMFIIQLYLGNLYDFILFIVDILRGPDWEAGWIYFEMIFFGLCAFSVIEFIGSLTDWWLLSNYDFFGFFTVDLVGILIIL